MRGNLAHLCPHFFAQNARNKPIMSALLGFKLRTNLSQSCLPLVSQEVYYFSLKLYPHLTDTLPTPFSK
jgi:hypothetical protein